MRLKQYWGYSNFVIIKQLQDIGVKAANNMPLVISLLLDLDIVIILEMINIYHLIHPSMAALDTVMPLLYLNLKEQVLRMFMYIMIGSLPLEIAMYHSLVI